MEGGLENQQAGHLHRRRTGGRQAAEHAGQRTRGRPAGRPLARHSAAQRLSSTPYIGQNPHKTANFRFATIRDRTWPASSNLRDAVPLIVGNQWRTRKRSMQWRLCQVVFWIALGTPIFGQVNEATLRTLYGNPVNGSYTVRPGVTMATANGPKGEVCVLTITGPTTERQLMAIIDIAVPSSSRGLLLGQFLDCAGICQSVRDYEKVTISSAVMAGQIANPAAIISFKGKNCEERTKEARVQGFLISRPKQPSK